nr:uncharacterized protein LOC128697671 [Cherax quadricarinatus]
MVQSPARVETLGLFPYTYCPCSPSKQINSMVDIVYCGTRMAPEVVDNERGTDAEIPLQVAEDFQEEYFTSYEDVEIHRLMVSGFPPEQKHICSINQQQQALV